LGATGGGISGCHNRERICRYQIRDPLCSSWGERRANLSLPAAVLRSTALTILGTAGIPSREVLLNAFQEVMAYVAKGKFHIDTERVPLAEIENAWQRDQLGCRLVIIP
jgi:hypothetical protein